MDGQQSKPRESARHQLQVLRGVVTVAQRVSFERQVFDDINFIKFDDINLTEDDLPLPFVVPFWATS